MDAFPLIVRVHVPGVADAGEVDTEVYCVNATSEDFAVDVHSNSFTTVDEEVGTVVEHGSAPVQTWLAPGAAVRVAQVRGWEWDGHVGITVDFTRRADGGRARKTYALKRGAEPYTVPGLGKEGCVVPPEVPFR